MLTSHCIEDINTNLLGFDMNNLFEGELLQPETSLPESKVEDQYIPQPPQNADLSIELSEKAISQ